MVVDIISASDEIADTEDSATKKEAIQKLKNTFKDKVSEFMNACKRLRADAKKVDHNLDDKFDKISEELEKLLGAGIDYTKAYIKHDKKEKKYNYKFFCCLCNWCNYIGIIWCLAFCVYKLIHHPKRWYFFSFLFWTRLFISRGHG